MSNGEGSESIASKLSSWNCCGFFLCFMTFDTVRGVEVGSAVADSEGSRRKRRRKDDRKGRNQRDRKKVVDI